MGEMPSSIRRYSSWAIRQSSIKEVNCSEGMVVAAELERGQM
jgi:hypothetical protein